MINGFPVIISPEHISGVIGDKDYTTIQSSRQNYMVAESPEEVVRKIMDYKVKMVHLQSILCQPEPSLELADEFESDLRELAGLEQTP
jgi:uncharacterized protein YlzI (FlbEa/FlbD family)